MENKKCIVCDKEIIRENNHGSWNRKKYCSIECKNKQRRKKAIKIIYDKKCKSCNTDFLSTIKRKEYCSTNCGDLYNYYKNREKKILYQRSYDRSHPELKKAQDEKRRRTTNKNKKRWIQKYSRDNYYNKLLDLYGGCQLCNLKDNLQINHTNYTKDITDCMLLCLNCHKNLHRKYNPLIWK